MNNRLIDLSDIEKLCHIDREIMLYGFYAILNIKLSNSLHSSVDEIITTEYSRVYDFNDFDQSKGDIVINRTKTICGSCKTALTSLLIYNYRQVRAGKPIIPHIFIIGSETSYQFKLDYKRLASSHGYQYSDENSDYDVTNSELRRCYKLYAEASGDLKAVVEMTFHFFVLQDNPGNQKPFRLKKISPFWNAPEFIAAWNQRIVDPNRLSQKKKQLDPQLKVLRNLNEQLAWRTQVKKLVSEIDQSNLLRVSLFNESLSRCIKNVNAALISAAKQGNTDIFDKLVNASYVKINAKNKQGCTALMWAAYNGHLEIVERLLDIPDIDPNAINRDGNTALMAAAWRGHKEIVIRLVCTPGVDILTVNNDGSTALISAIESGHKEIAQIIRRAIAFSAVRHRRLKISNR